MHVITIILFVIAIKHCDDRTDESVFNVRVLHFSVPMCRRAFVSSLQQNPHPTYDQLLEGLRREMKKKGFHQKPQLSSAQVRTPVL
jgi:hypothetical protein